jgi:hypothetical protein
MFLYPEDCVLETLDGSDCILPFRMSIRGSSIKYLTRSITEEEISPGRIRKLTVALAV